MSMGTANKIFYRHKSYVFLFIGILLSTLYISNENILHQFAPKRSLVAEDKLSNYFIVAEAILGIAYTMIGINLIVIYKEFKKFYLPWEGYLWIYAGFVLVGAMARFSAMLDFYYSYYWIEGYIKMLSAILSIAIAVAFVADSKKIREMKTPEEYARLAKAYEDLLTQFNEINKPVLTK